jgi:hypothetical protein
MPAMVRVVTLELFPGFAGTLNTTAPEPEPLAPLVIVTKLAA